MEYYILATWILCAAVIYIDAKQRKLKATGSWAFCGLIFGIVGVLIYIVAVVQPNKRNV